MPDYSPNRSRKKSCGARPDFPAGRFSPENPHQRNSEQQNVFNLDPAEGTLVGKPSGALTGIEALQVQGLGC
jgi:hypothetical protein